MKLDSLAFGASTSVCRMTSAVRPKPHYLLGLLPQSRNAERDHVADLQELRLRLHAECHARRGAGDDDVAGLQNHELRAVPHEVCDAEDHRLGGAFLTRLAIHGKPHVEVLRLGDLILGDEPRAKRTESLRALALRPLAGALDLEFALRDVVGKAIASDCLPCGPLGEITGPAAAHDA